VNSTSDPKSPGRRRIRRFLHRRDDPSRFGFSIDRVALKDTLAVVFPTLVVVLVAFWIASRYIRPAPPDTFVMSTGAEGGAYHLFAERYRDILARDGITVELRRSAGAIDNMARLRDPASGVDAAFVQGGISEVQKNAGLLSLGSIYYEPLWIFYRAPIEVKLLNQLKGKRIAVGAEGSGTRALALQLLHAVGLNDPSTVQPLGGNMAADALIEGKVDAVFMVGAPDAPVVQRLVKSQGVRLLNLENAQAFSRRFPFLTALTLPRGVIDLAQQLPERDVTLLAATANIVVKEEFHPALAFLLLHAATEIHAGSGLLQRHKEFPSARETEFQLSAQAERYFSSGPPLLRRYLPFWLANLIERMVVLLVPLFAVLVPAFKILPALLQWRVKSRVFRWYGEIKYLEEELARGSPPDQAAIMLQRLDEIERGVTKTSVPNSYSDYAYNLRTHLDVVRNRILRTAHALPADGNTHTAAPETPLKPSP